MGDKSNTILVAVDVSNFCYACIWGSVGKWQKLNADESSIIHTKEETDQNHLPNPTNFPSYRKLLHDIVQSKLELILHTINVNHPCEVSMATGIDIVLVEDDRIHNNFRKIKYPQYKGQRKYKLKVIDEIAVKEYIQNVIFKELELEDKYGYKIIKVQDCECDDVVAILMKRYPDYICRIIISSDKDFLQLENVSQYDVKKGEAVERYLTNTKGEMLSMTPKEFLLWKTIRGDISDNIPSVFNRYGDIKTYNLIKDKPRLKEMLREDLNAIKRYSLNKYLVDFNSIPKDVEEKIYSVLSEKLDGKDKTKTNIINDNTFTLDGCIIL